MNTMLYRSILKFAYDIVQINTKTKQVYIIKERGKLSDTPDIPVNAKEYLHNYLDVTPIHPSDMWELEILSDPDLLINYCNSGIGTSMILRHFVDGTIVWRRVEILFSEDYSDESPYIFLLSQNLGSAESTFFDSYSEMSKRFHKILRVNLKTDAIDIVKEYRFEENLREKKNINSYSEMLSFTVDTFIHEEDIPSFLRHLTPEYVKNFFSRGNSIMNFYYRRKIGALFRWTKLSILPTSSYSAECPIFFYFVEDVHRAVIKTFDMQAAASYAKFFSNDTKKFADSYYENLISVIAGFTQHYVDFYMIDLEKDLYIQYKTVSGLLPEYHPMVGSYSEISNSFIDAHCSEEQAELLRNYSTSDKLKELMQNCLTLEYEFELNDHVKYKTICQKIESYHGVPEKLLCRTIRCEAQDQLIVRTFGNFEVSYPDGTPLHFSRKLSKQLLAYLIDKHGYPVTSKDIVIDILEKPSDDINAIKYVSTLVRRAIDDLEKAGFSDIILKEQKTLRINTKRINCDYYNLLRGDYSCLLNYHNEYMKEYSWAETTNAEILSMVDK